MDGAPAHTLTDICSYPSKEQRRALTAFTEGPIRQGVLESPWESLVAGFILGDEVKAQQVLKPVRGDSEGAEDHASGCGNDATRVGGPGR